jgi:hypothetical protein
VHPGDDPKWSHTRRTALIISQYVTGGVASDVVSALPGGVSIFFFRQSGDIRKNLKEADNRYDDPAKIVGAFQELTQMDPRPTSDKVQQDMIRKLIGRIPD